MIAGVGVDLVEVSRVERELELDPAWRESLFTPLEAAYCEKKHYPAQHFAAHFAGKEALFKALPGNPPRGFNWLEIEISHHSSGAPQLTLNGALAAYAHEQGVCSISISLSHTREYALAGVIVEAEPRS